MRKRPVASNFKRVAVDAVFFAIIAIVVVVFWHTALRPVSPLAVQAKHLPVAANRPAPAAANVPGTPTEHAKGPSPENSDFRERPFPAAYESPRNGWTLADGRDTNVIRQLAHNHLEYDRMVEENPRILRRQLVYLKETAASVFEQAKLTGRPVRQLTLPSLDGQELQFEIAKSQSSGGSSRQGMFSGHLANDANSLVTLAFMDGREAFTVLSPQENIFVVGEPREDGQVIVKQIDPNTYGQGPEQAANDGIMNQPASK